MADRARFQALFVTYLAITAAGASAHIGNNFAAYLVGGLIDRFAFSPLQMGAWSMVETLFYAFAMFGVASRVAGLSPRKLGVVASALIISAQVLSAYFTGYLGLVLLRTVTGLGFGLMNSAVNLAAGRLSHPARAISIGIGLQVILFAAIHLILPVIGQRMGVSGMFVALGVVSAILGVGALWLPGAAPHANIEAAKARPRPIGPDGLRVLAVMGLFSFGALAVWPFMERAARAIHISAVEFGWYQGLATLLTAVGSFGLAAVMGKLKRGPLILVGLAACGTGCAMLTTVGGAFAFATALIVYNVSWFIVYALLLDLGFSVDPAGRLAVMTTGTWLLSQSAGSLGAGFVAKIYGSYTAVGPLGLVTCVLAILIVWPLARRVDRKGDREPVTRGVLVH